MRPEKKFISAEYLKRLQHSPFFLVVDYRGLKVSQFTEFRKRLRAVGAEAGVVKNTIFRVAAQEAGLANLQGALAGQLAVVTGRQDIAGAAKTVKSFQAEFEKPKLQFGYLGSQRLSVEDVRAIADLPPLGELRAKILGALQAPARRVAYTLSAPGGQLARVIRAKAEATGAA